MARLRRIIHVIHELMRWILGQKGLSLYRRPRRQASVLERALPTAMKVLILPEGGHSCRLDPMWQLGLGEFSCRGTENNLVFFRIVTVYDVGGGVAGLRSNLFLATIAKNGISDLLELLLRFEIGLAVRRLEHVLGQRAQISRI